MNDLATRPPVRARLHSDARTLFDSEPQHVADDHQAPDPPVDAGAPASPAALPAIPAGFAGFSWTRIGLTAAGIGAMLWGGWMTSQLLELRRHRVVSVSIASMANDFIGAESRSGNSPEQTDADTRAYMLTLQKVLKERAASGEAIVVSEAVVGSSVPNITADVRAAVGKIMSAAPPPRVQGRAPTAALAPVAPPALAGAAQGAPQPAPGYVPSGGDVPQGSPLAGPGAQALDQQPPVPFGAPGDGQGAGDPGADQ